LKQNVAVVFGGRSGEHEVSVRSAESILRALRRDKYNVLEYFISKDGKWHPRVILPEPGANPGIDVVFPVLHGTFGEDGTMQGLFELADLPYVGPGVLASSVCMDKDIAKRLCRERGLPVVEWITLYRGKLDASAVLARFQFPVFVKPANLGSSVGITKAHDEGELKQALELAARYDRKVIVERCVGGAELECSVLGNEEPLASTPCEILPSREFYDYEDKYVLDRAQFRLPAELPATDMERVRQLAVACYQATGCEGMARVDFLRDAETGAIYINEINTIPGFTSISMYPKMWEYSGIPYPDLLDRLIEYALERHRAKLATRFTL